MNMEDTMETSMRIISSWDYETSDICPNTSLFNHHSREEVLEFMRAIKDLHATFLFFTTTTTNTTFHVISNKKIAQCQHLLRLAKKRLSSEFFSLLKTNSKHNIYQFSIQDDDSNNNKNNGDLILEDTSSTADLKLIVDCMMSAGFGKKCLKIFKLTRRSFVEDALLRLEIRRLKKSPVQKLDWEAIDSKIIKWLKTIGICIKIFSHEKLLCENIFSSGTLPSVRDSCFAEVCKEAALVTVIIPGKLAKHYAKKSPEKIFKYLKLYEGVSMEISEIDKVFSSELTSPVRSKMRSSLRRISEAIKFMLAEFDASIQKDVNKEVVLGGGTHPWTKYVISYLVNLSYHAPALEKILVDYPVSLQSPLPESYFEGETLLSPVALQFGWLVLVLIAKLDAKSEFYKDSALSYLFLANNLQYIVKKVKCTRLGSVLGKKWVAKHDSKVGQYAANYERMGWGRVASVIPKDITAEVPIDKVKDCFKRFNADFEEEYRKQMDWVVHDPKLRNEMKASIVRKVDSRYRRMYDKYNVLLSKTRERGKVDSVIRFTPEDLQSYFSDLLDGHDDDDVVVSMFPGKYEMTSSHEGKENPFLQRRSRRLLLLVRQYNHQ